MAEPRKAIVRCVDDYERATERVAEIGYPEPGSPEEAELTALVEAIENGTRGMTTPRIGSDAGTAAQNARSTVVIAH